MSKNSLTFPSKDWNKFSSWVWAWLSDLFPISRKKQKGRCITSETPPFPSLTLGEARRQDATWKEPCGKELRPSATSHGRDLGSGSSSPGQALRSLHPRLASWRPLPPHQAFQPEPPSWAALADPTYRSNEMQIFVIWCHEVWGNRLCSKR